MAKDYRTQITHGEFEITLFLDGSIQIDTWSDDTFVIARQVLSTTSMKSDMRQQFDVLCLESVAAE